MPGTRTQDTGSACDGPRAANAAATLPKDGATAVLPLRRTMNMNPHERLYRQTGRALFVLVGLWAAAMLLVVVTPAKLWKAGLPSLVLFDGVVPLLLLAMVVASVVRLVAYMRWTGKYPYYFLFGKARGSGDGAKKGEDAASSREVGD